MRLNSSSFSGLTFMQSSLISKGHRTSQKPQNSLLISPSPPTNVQSTTMSSKLFFANIFLICLLLSTSICRSNNCLVHTTILSLLDSKINA